MKYLFMCIFIGFFSSSTFASELVDGYTVNASQYDTIEFIKAIEQGMSEINNIRLMNTDSETKAACGIVSRCLVSEQCGGGSGCICYFGRCVSIFADDKT